MTSGVGVRKKSKIGVCVMCRKTFQAARSDAKTCSSKCRKQWSRYNNWVAYQEYKEAMKMEQSERLSKLINNKFVPGKR